MGCVWSRKTNHPSSGSGVFEDNIADPENVRLKRGTSEHENRSHVTKPRGTSRGTEHGESKAGAERCAVWNTDWENNMKGFALLYKFLAIRDGTEKDRILNVVLGKGLHEVDKFLQEFPKLRGQSAREEADKGPVAELLVLAVRNNQPDLVKFLIEAKGADVNCEADLASGFRLPVQEAISGMNLDMLRYLIKKGAHVGLQSLTLEDYSPLSDTLQNQWLEGAELLLEHGADPNPEMLTSHTPLRDAVAQQWLEGTQLLLQYGTDMNQSVEGQSPPLETAVEKKWLAGMRVLLQYGADTNQTGRNGFLPIVTVIKAKWSAGLRVLLEHGADVNAVQHTHYDHRIGYYARTPLVETIFQQWLEGAALLLDHGAKVNLTGESISAPLVQAVRQRWLEVLELILDHGTCEDLTLPLVEAVRYQWLMGVKLLLGYGADVNSVPLMTAVSHRWPEGLKLLLEKGADVNSQVHVPGERIKMPPISVAAGKFDLSCMEQLLEAGADPNVGDSDGWSPLFVLGYSSVKRSHHFPGQVEAAVKLLLGAGAKVNCSQDTLVLSKSLRETVPLLLFAAGEEKVLLEDGMGTQENQLPPPDTEEKDLRNQCRKVIRTHLLTLDPHTNLFLRIPELEWTEGRGGLPRVLVSYLLYHQTLDIDWEELEKLDSCDSNEKST